MICGINDIDVDDWRENTIYRNYTDESRAHGLALFLDHSFLTSSAALPADKASRSALARRAPRGMRAACSFANELLEAARFTARLPAPQTGMGKASGLVAQNLKHGSGPHLPAYSSWATQMTFPRF